MGISEKNLASCLASTEEIFEHFKCMSINNIVNRVSTVSLQVIVVNMRSVTHSPVQVHGASGHNGNHVMNHVARVYKKHPGYASVTVSMWHAMEKVQRFESASLKNARVVSCIDEL